MDLSSISSSYGTTAIQSAASSQTSAADSDFETKLQQAYDSGDKEELKEACEDFEAIFLNMMYSQMKATIQKSDLVEESAGHEIFQSMLDEEMIGQAADRGVGMADLLYSQLSRNMDSIYKVADNEETNATEQTSEEAAATDVSASE